jgi:hypothetical protein
MDEEKTQESIDNCNQNSWGSNQQSLIHFFANEIKCRFLMQVEQYGAAVKTFDSFAERQFEGIWKLEPFFSIRSKQLEATIMFRARNFGSLSSFIDRELQHLSGLRYNKNELFFYIILKIRLLIELEDYRTAHLLIVEQIPYAFGLQLIQKYIELKILELQVLIKSGALENAVNVCEDLRILINRANPNLKAEFYFQKGLLALSYIGDHLSHRRTATTEASTLALNNILVSARHCLAESVKSLNFEHAKGALFLMANVHDIQNNHSEKENMRTKFVKVAKVGEFIAKNFPKVEESGNCLESIMSFQTYILRVMQKFLLA